MARGKAWDMADDTLFLLLEGYGWLPAQRRRAVGEVARVRLMGRRAAGICGPEAARFFYEEDGIRRGGAVPGMVRSTLFGQTAVHTLDGAEHRARKAILLPLLDGARVAGLVRHAVAAWDREVPAWRQRRRVVLFDRAARVLASAVYAWAGLPLDDSDAPGAAADMVALVDGFATVGPRHWRARRARRRREAWLGGLVRQARSGTLGIRSGTPAHAVIRHRDSDGALLDRRVAAVELLNLLRPTVAVAWFVAFAAHALHRHPGHRARLAGGDAAFTEAFVHELRRFYPFTPFVGGVAVTDLAYRGEPIPEGTLVLLDVYGQLHDPAVWEDPYAFSPDRFLGRRPGPYELIPQGGGHPATGHRCPGEDATVELLKALVPRLAALDYRVPDQDLAISLRRVPARVASGFVLDDVRAPVSSPTLGTPGVPA